MSTKGFKLVESISLIIEGLRFGGGSSDCNLCDTIPFKF